MAGSETPDTPDVPGLGLMQVRSIEIGLVDFFRLSERASIIPQLLTSVDGGKKSAIEKCTEFIRAHMFWGPIGPGSDFHN